MKNNRQDVQKKECAIAQERAALIQLVTIFSCKLEPQCADANSRNPRRFGDLLITFFARGLSGPDLMAASAISLESNRARTLRTNLYSKLRVTNDDSPVLQIWF